jgi:hypothetical protein
MIENHNQIHSIGIIITNVFQVSIPKPERIIQTHKVPKSPSREAYNPSLPKPNTIAINAKTP